MCICLSFCWGQWCRWSFTVEIFPLFGPFWAEKREYLDSERAWWRLAERARGKADCAA